MISKEKIKKFWEQVNKHGPKVAEYVWKLYPELKGTYCWEWTGRKNKDGYGQFSNQGAHRFAYILRFGENLLTRSTHVCHKCDNTSCVRWEHLFHGSAKMNSVDMMMKGRGPWSFTEWDV